MIRISRGPEPTALGPIRNTQLAALRALGRDPKSKEIDGYGVVAVDLWRAQHSKCCYCEQRIPQGFNDVEHYRPKASADRRPGCNHTHGYWWLAFTWENLLFSCPACNRSKKKSRFPLDVGALALTAENPPPGNERPLLIDPSSIVNPIEHIEFVHQANPVGAPRQWWARPRNGSFLGSLTIEVCGLNRSELLELREHHYLDVVVPHANAINLAVQSADVPALTRDFRRALNLLQPRGVFVGLTYDALCLKAPDAGIKALLGIGWPLPSFVA